MRLARIVYIEFLWLVPDELLAAGQRRVTDSVDDSGFAGVVPPHRGGHSWLEINFQFGSPFAEREEISHGDNQKMRAPTSCQRQIICGYECATERNELRNVSIDRQAPFSVRYFQSAFPTISCPETIDPLSWLSEGYRSPVSSHKGTAAAC